MNIEVIGTAQQVTEGQVRNKTVVVVDVLRATSVMVTALHNGATGVIPVLSPEEAFALRDQLPHVVLGGERNAEPITGFDYGNSPLSYTTDVVKGQTLVMTTTNGTLAIQNAMAAKELVVAAFINDKAVSHYLQEKQDVVFVCSGNNGLYTLEDALCVGRIIYLLKQINDRVKLSDFALSLEQLYASKVNNLLELAMQGHHYQVLDAKGYHPDLEYCFRSDMTQIIPIWDGQVLKNISR